jgi:hypothetical protein
VTNPEHVERSSWHSMMVRIRVRVTQWIAPASLRRADLRVLRDLTNEQQVAPSGRGLAAPPPRPPPVGHCAQGGRRTVRVGTTRTKGSQDHILSLRRPPAGNGVVAPALVIYSGSASDLEVGPRCEARASS